MEKGGIPSDAKRTCYSTVLRDIWRVAYSYRSANGKSWNKSNDDCFAERLIASKLHEIKIEFQLDSVGSGVNQFNRN
jgi:hypothetical protein